MNENRIPFLATPGGKSDTICRTLLAERTAMQQVRLDYIKAKGIENLYANENHVAGLFVKPDKIPAGFRKDKKYGVDSDGHILVVPDAKQRDTYKDVQAELASLSPIPGCWQLDARLGFGGYLSGRTLMMCSCEILGDSLVLSVPKMENNQFVPPDSTQLKHSEYWALKEKAEVTKTPEVVQL